MAVALEPSLTSKSFHNWLKGALAVRFTKEGLEDLVTTEIPLCQTDLLQGVWTLLGIPTGTICASCTTANLLACPTQGYCMGRTCNFHDPSVPDKKPGQKCPNKICDALRDRIRREHRFNGPSWKNTNARGWCSDAFEIAKCFMPPDGYADIKCFAETDFNGIVSVVINSRRFQSKFTAQLNANSNICRKAREIGRAVRHSPDLSMSDTEFISCIDGLIDLLSDSGYLATDVKAQEAVRKMNLLRTNALTIHANDITEILDDYFTKSISQKRCELEQEMEDIRLRKIEAFRKEYEQICEKDKENMQNVIESKSKTILDTIEAKGNDAIQSMENKCLTALKNIEEERTKALSDVAQQHQHVVRERTTILNLVVAYFSKVQAELNDFRATLVAQLNVLKEIKQQAESDLKKLNICRNTDGDTSVAEFKSELVKFYREQCHTLPISPLVNDTDVSLLELYVQLRMEAIDLRQRLRGSKAISTKTSVNNYKQLLFRNESSPYKHIYITANAGEGKTSFSKYVCLAWCQAHKPLQSLSGKFEQENLEALKYFDFVFLISLRDVNRSLCDVDDFILNFIKTNFPDLTGHSELAENILRNNHCLAVFDGLDEWKHPKTCPIAHSEYDIPHAKNWKKCTILTTTRPWRFDALSLPSTKVDQHVEIKELDSSSTVLLERNILNILQDPLASDEAHMSIDNFHEIILAFKLEDICKIPYVNSQLMCLWYEGEELGRSKCEIYTNIIEITIARGLKKPCVQDLDMITQINQTDLTECVLRKPQCCKHAMLLLSLGELAFNTIVCKRDEATLNFDESVVLRYLKSERAMTFCLQTGLLSQSKVYGYVSRSHRNISFQHRTLHEYFAALYLQRESTKHEATESVLETCLSLTNILEMSNIFIFLCGLRPTLYCTIFEKLVNIVSADEITKTYRTQMVWYNTRERYYESMFNFQSMQLDCMQEIQRQATSNLNVHLEDIIINTRSKSEACISILNDILLTNRNKIKTLCLRDCERKEVYSIMQSLDLLSLRSLEKLELWTVSEQQHNAEKLLLENRHSLKCVDIRFGNFQYFRTVPITEKSVPLRNFETNITNMTLLQSFCLELCSLSHSTLEQITHVLSHRHTIRQIGMGFNSCVDHGVLCGGVELDLTEHKTLQCLYLVAVPISNLNVNIESLEQCEIGLLPSGIVTSLLQKLPSAKKLKILACGPFFGNDVRRVTEAIPKILILESLFILGVELFSFRLSIPLEMNRLEDIWLNGVIMPISTFRDLVINLSYLVQSVTVRMTDCFVIPAHEYAAERKYMKILDRFRVIFDGQKENNQYEFTFQTVKLKTAKTTKNIYTRQ